MNPEKFVLELSKHNFELTDKQKQQFKLYFKMLIEVNEHVNLTRITEEDEVYLKHFYDSITPLFTFGAVLKMVQRSVMLVLVPAFLQFRSRF